MKFVSRNIIPCIGWEENFPPRSHGDLGAGRWRALSVRSFSGNPVQPAAREETDQRNTTAEKILLRKLLTRKLFTVSLLKENFLLLYGEQLRRKGKLRQNNLRGLGEPYNLRLNHCITAGQGCFTLRICPGMGCWCQGGEGCRASCSKQRLTYRQNQDFIPLQLPGARPSPQRSLWAELTPCSWQGIQNAGKSSLVPSMGQRGWCMFGTWRPQINNERTPAWGNRVKKVLEFYVF